MDDPVLQGIRILLVEDSYDTRESVRIWLKQQGADVYAVSSAEDGMTLLPQAQPHLVLCDIALPGEDGYSLIRRIRSLPPEQGGLVPAAAFTAYSTAEHRALAMAAGFSGHIPKPVDLDSLIGTLESLIQAGSGKPVWTTTLEGLPSAPEPPLPGGGVSRGKN